MIDIKQFRAKPEEYEKSAELRGLKVDFAKLKKLDAERLTLTGQIDELRSKLNVKGKPDAKALAELQKTKGELEKLEKKQAGIDTDLEDLLLHVPNLMASDTPKGGEEANTEERTWGKAEKSDAQDHLTYLEEKGWVDFERGAKVAGSKFYYLIGPMVRLERSILFLVWDKLTKAGFLPMNVPHLVNSRVASGTGFLPRGEEKQVYSIDGEDLHLIATAEIPLTGFHADEIIPADELPKQYAALSPSYRREAGAYGKHSKGLYRVHQFSKVEMYVFCKPNESGKWLDKLVNLEEEIVKALGIPYRVTRTASGDMSAPAFKKFDIEYWSPVDGQYRELTSASNCTDFQARRLNIRTKGEKGNEPVHTLNATAIATSRALIAVIENHQKDGKVVLPDELAKYYGGNEL